MIEQTQNLLILARAKGNTAELRVLAEKCENRDDARVIFTEILQIAKKLKDKHRFGEKKTVVK